MKLETENYHDAEHLGQWSRRFNQTTDTRLNHGLRIMGDGNLISVDVARGWEVRRGASGRGQTPTELFRRSG